MITEWLVKLNTDYRKYVTEDKEQKFLIISNDINTKLW